MKTVELHGRKAAGRVALVDDADFDLVSPYRWYVLENATPPGGRRPVGPYAVATPHFDGRHKSVLMHRLITGYAQVDHVDHNGLNNQRINLRSVTCGQNQANAEKTTRPTSSWFKGVCWNKRMRRWHVQLGVNGRKLHIGFFADEWDAAFAYDAAALDTWGEYASLNFP